MHKYTNRFILTILILIVATACGRDAENNTAVPVPDKQGVEAVDSHNGDMVVTILKFKEVETGVAPFNTRMLISERYMRIDNGIESDGYILFDRKKNRIFSVVDEDKNILVVDPVALLSDPPADLIIRAEQIDTHDAPEISGIKPAYYQFYANDTLCYHVVTADGLLPDVRDAMQSYRKVLSTQQMETLTSVPEVVQTPCFLANYVYAPELYISKGFPIEQWDESGYHRSLVNIEENIEVQRSLFNLPAGYEYYGIGGVNM